MNVKTTVILLVLLGLLAAGVFLIEDGNDVPEVSRNLFEGFLLTDVSEMTWSVGGTPPVTVQRVDDGWVVLVSGMTVPASEIAVQDVLGELDRIRVEKKIPAREATATRRQQYLLTPPAHFISFVMRGETQKVFMGAPGQMRDTVYAQKDGSDDVLLIDDGLLDTIGELETKALRSTEILTWSIYDIGGIKISGRDGVIFEAVRDPAENTLWQAKVPFTGYVDPRAMESDLLSSALKLEVTEFVKDGAEEADLARFGLAPARYTLEFSKKGNPDELRTLLLGAEVPGSVGFLYFMEAGKPFVYSGRRGDLLNLLAGDPADWRDRNLTRLGWRAVGAFRIRQGGEDCEIERVHGEWHLVKPERMALDQAEVEEWFTRVRDLAAEAFIDQPDLAALGLAEPAGELTFWPPVESEDDHGPLDEDAGEEQAPGERPEPLVRILIGAPVPEKDTVYVMRDGDGSTAYEAGPDFVELVERSYYAFKKRLLFEDGLADQRVHRIVRSFGGKDVDLATVDGRWPVGTNSAALNGVVSKLLSLTAVRWVGPAEGRLADYGLDENLKLSIRIYVLNEGGDPKEYGVDLGDRMEDGFYARAWRDGEFMPDVFIVEKRMAEPVVQILSPGGEPESVEKGLQVPLVKPAKDEQPGAGEAEDELETGSGVPGDEEEMGDGEPDDGEEGD